MACFSSKVATAAQDLVAAKVDKVGDVSDGDNGDNVGGCGGGDFDGHVGWDKANGHGRHNE